MKKKRQKKERVTLAEVFVGVRGTQEYVLELNKKVDNLGEKVDSMNRDFSSHFTIVDNRLGKIETKLHEHDQRFDGVDEQIQGVRIVVDDIAKKVESHESRVTALETAEK